jgi:hypothetical protein
VSSSSERAHRVDSSSEGTSSSDEQESSSLSLSSLNAHHIFDITVEFSASSSSAYLHLFSEEAIGDTEWNLLDYKCQHSDLYGVTGDPSNEARMTVRATLELPVATGNDYVSIVHRCYGPQ